MIKSSIIYTITFFFILSSISIFLAFLYLIEYDKQLYTDELNNQYSFIANSVLFNFDKNVSQNEIINQIKPYKMQNINSPHEMEFIIANSIILQNIHIDQGSASILKHKNKHFLFINNQKRFLLLEHKAFQPYRYKIFQTIFILIFFMTLIFYIVTIQKLKPLKQLKDQIESFAKGELKEISIKKSNSTDEISQVTNAFIIAVKQIKKLNHSRNLFLRNIFHELKTPITKGLITTELIAKDKNQQRLVDSFTRLENLINEFAFIEQISSGAMFSQKKPYRLMDIFDEAIDISMVELEKIDLKINDISVNVDFKFFSIAIKNMIDNAIKYSNDSKITIEANSESIVFKNNGEKLKQDLSFYIEPFTKGEHNLKSFGLGLYIVHNILKNHKLKLKYNYENGINHFIFDGIENILVKS